MSLLLYHMQHPTVYSFLQHMLGKMSNVPAAVPLWLSPQPLSSSAEAANGGAGNAFARSASAVVRGGGDILAEGHKFRN